MTESAAMDETDVTVANVMAVAGRDLWAITFGDGVVLYCNKAPERNEAHVDALIADHHENGDDPQHTNRMRAMIAAVRAHEAASS